MSSLVYICSLGHSGSTLLDLLLGSIPGIFSCGELQYLPWQLVRNGEVDGGITRQDICTCLNTFRDCPVWHKTVESLSDQIGFNIFKYPFRFRITLLRPQIYQLNMSRNRFLIKRIYNRTIMTKSMRMLSGPIRALAYPSTRRNWMLMDTLANVTESPFILDSSKDIDRFHILHEHRPQNTFLIILARDVRRIASSYIKWKSDPIQAADGWALYYTRILKFLKLNPQIRSLFIWYEEMCEHPELVRNKIANFLNLPPISPMETEIDTRSYHMVAGNPSRYCGKVNIRIDNSWKSNIKNTQMLTYLDSLSIKMNPVFDKLQFFSE